MEQRNPLSQGTQVNRFVIDRVIGYGASCLVYEAHYLDSGNHRKEIILKECYPYNSGTTRIGSKIVWSSLEEQEKAFQRFNNAYEIAAKIQNEAGAQSVSVYSLDKFEENGTQYVATIPNGNSYDKTKNDDIADIIRTALALTNAVGLYHKAGYLHLDIKPSNFIATEDQTGKGKNIVLFDVDTVVARDDIQSGNLRGVSYSKEFAAPEQKMQQIKKMCPATDLFAVGAVLFERVINRPVDSTDSTLFATWEYDERFDAKKVNPKAKRLLTEIFHKTLAANVKRRYQSAEELAKALDELLSVVTDGKPYLISIFSNTVNVIGRRNDIDLISKAFSSGKKTVFLHGVGGIGKSTLAVAYADEYQKSYDAVLFLRYRDSLETLLNEIDIYNCETTDSEEKRRILRNLLDRNVLVIIDNFDVATDEDEYLFDLLELRTNIIFTTRTDFSDTLNGDATQIEVNALGQSFLFELFSHISKTDIIDENENALKEMFRLVGNNTYAVELLARQITASDCSIETLAKKVADGLYGLSGLERIRSNKDGRIIKKTVPDIIRSLYNMANLNENQKQVLRNLYLLRFLNIDKQTYLEFCWPRPYNMDIVNDLVEIGWVQKNNRYYYLHPLVEELVDTDLKPNEDNCTCVFWRMRNKMNQCFENDGVNQVTEDIEQETNIRISTAFLMGIDFSINSNLQLAIKWLEGFISEKYGFVFPSRQLIAPLLSKLERYANMCSIDLNTKAVVFIIIYGSWLCEYRFLYRGEIQDIINRNQKRADGLNHSFETAKNIAESLVESDQGNALNRLYSLISASMENDTGFLPKKYYLERFQERPQCFDCNLNDCYFFDDYIESVQKKTVEPDEETIIQREFIVSENKPEFIQKFSEDEKSSLYERAKRIGYCTEFLFFYKYKYQNRKPDEWEMIHRILSIEECVISKCLNDKLSYYEKDECEFSLDQNHCNQCVVSAALDDKDSFKYYSGLLFEKAKDTLDYCVNREKRIFSENQIRDAFLIHNSLLDSLYFINKSSWILPQLISLEEYCKQLLLNNIIVDERVLGMIYDSIVTCVKNALDEPNILKKQKVRIEEILIRYEKKIKLITNSNFSFRSEE